MSHDPADWRKRPLRTVLGFLLSIAVAALGTTLVESPFEKYTVGRSIRSSMFREDVLACIFAFVIGYLLNRKWEIAGARGVWAVGVGLFLWRVSIPYGGRHVVSWEIAGTESVLGPDWTAMANWTLYTLTTLRLLFYSVGAYAAFAWRSRRAEKG